MTSSPDTTSTEPRRAARFPDFFIVGHAKCGTTALYEMLRRHPDIYMPEYKRGAGKEPWFFAQDNPQPQHTGERSVAFTGRREVTLEQYLALFAEARAEQLVGEASTSYLWSTSAPARIAEARPDARIIAILREPASFLHSLHEQLVRNHHESELDFRKALSLDEPRREGRQIPSYSYWPGALIYSDRVRYVEQLRRYHALFAREQVLVLIYDDFRSDNEATLRRVFGFLGVDDQVKIEPVEVNPSVGVRSVWLDNRARALKAGRGPASSVAKAIIKGATPWKLRHELLYPLRNRIVYREPRAADEQFMHELRRRYKGEVTALSEYLGRDLVTLWGYDRID
jgi:Sulfotransferase family